MKSVSMVAVSALLNSLSYGKQITIPLTRKHFAEPVTRSQKMISDYHHNRLKQAYQSAIQLLPEDE